MGLRMLTVEVSGSWTRTERRGGGSERAGETSEPLKLRREVGVQYPEGEK